MNAFALITQGKKREGKTMTNGDWVRSLSDEDLAELFDTFFEEVMLSMLEKLSDKGISAEVISLPIVSRKKHLDFLRAEVQNDG